jgi:hypothetical protein
MLALRRTTLFFVSLVGSAVLSPGTAMAGGAVQVSADLMGMKLFIDGVDTGLTVPATVGNLSPGKHEVRVRGECRVGAALVDIKEGETAAVKLSSATGRGLLTVKADPPVSTVVLDGSEISGPTVVECGEHSVSVAHPGYLPTVLRVEVDVDERRVVPILLEEVGFATIVISVRPESAEVILDGTLIGTGSTTADDIPAGPHIIEVRADGYESVSQQLLADPGQTLAYTWELDQTASAAVAAAPADSGTGRTKDRSSSGWGLSPLQYTGIGAATVGLGLGIYGITRFGKAASAYDEYVDRSQNGPGPQTQVQAIRSNEIIPARNAGLITTTLGTALLAGGVTVAVKF